MSHHCTIRDAKKARDQFFCWPSSYNFCLALNFECFKGHGLLMFMCVTWLIDFCDMTHSYIWHDSFARVTWLSVHPPSRKYKSSIYVTWLILIYAMTHSYTRHDSFARVTWLPVHPPPRKYDAFICVTWLIHTYDMTCVLQCVTVCCSVLQCVAVCCSVLQCVIVCCSVLQYTYDMTCGYTWQDWFINVSHSYM